MPELERMLSARLGEELDWPPTPDLTAGVMGRLDEPAPRRRSGPLRRPAAAPSRGCAVRLPSPPSDCCCWRAPPWPRPRRARRRARLPRASGRHRRAARDAADAAGRAPARPRHPHHARAARDSASSRSCRASSASPTVSTCAGVARRRAVAHLPPGRGCRAPAPRGSACCTSSAATSPEYLGKVVGPEHHRRAPAHRRRAERSGSRARRTSSSTAVRTAGSSTARLRLARNVLLVERGDLLIRLEGALARDRAVAIARSLR